MRISDWKEQILENKERAGVPLITHPGAEMLGKKIIHAVKDGETQYMSVKILAEKYPSAAVPLIMDLSVEAEAFGSEILFNENEVPAVKERIVSDGESVEKLKIPGLGSGRIPQYILAAKLAAQNIPGKPVFAGCAGPFTLAARLFDVSEIMMSILMEPETITVLLQKCTEFLISYCTAFKEAGAHGVIMAEPASGMLSPEQCADFASPFIKNIVDAVQDDDFMVIVHNCGNVDVLLNEMKITGAGGFHFGNKCNIVEAVKFMNEDQLVMGNIDPAGVLKLGTQEEVYSTCSSLLNDTAGFKNFILSTGCDTPPGTPSENIEAFFKALADFNSAR